MSQGTPQRKQNARRDNIVPCTVAQIHSMGEGEDHLTVGSLEVQYVTLVGVVVSVEQRSTKVAFSLDDRTGPPLEGEIVTSESDEQSRILSQLVEGAYVRVLGSIRSFEGRRILKTFKAFGLTDLNELTMHLAEVVHSHMALTVGETKSNASFKAEPMDTSSYLGGAEGSSGLGLDPKQNLVYELIRKCVTPVGISFDEVCSCVKSMSRSAVKDVVEFLSNEGHIYTTMDDSHYKATDGI